MPIDCFSSKAFEVLRSTLQKWLLFFAYEVIGLFYLFKFVSETGQNLQFSRIIFHSRGCPNFNSPNIQITIHQIVFLLVFVVVVVFFCFFSFVKFCVKQFFIFLNQASGGGACHIRAIQVCAAVKGMVFRQFTLGQGI